MTRDEFQTFMIGLRQFPHFLSAKRCRELAEELRPFDAEIADLQEKQAVLIEAFYEVARRPR